MKLVTKIWLSLALLIAGYVMTVVVTDIRSREDERFLQKIESESVPNLQHAHTAAVSAKLMIAAFQDAVVFADPGGVEQARAIAQELEESLGQIRGDDVASRGHQSAAGEIISSLTPFVADAGRLYLRLAKNDPDKELTSQARVMKERSDALTDAIAALQVRMRQNLTSSFEERRSGARAFRLISEVIMVVVLIAAVMFITALIVNLSRRLARLNVASATLTSGQYDISVEDHGRDEVSQLAHGFEAMRLAVAQRKRELEEFNQGLDQVVRERTVELEQRNQELSTQIQERQRAERLLRLVESAVDQIDDGVMIAPAVALRELAPEYVNSAFRRILGLGYDDLPSGRLLLNLDSMGDIKGGLERVWALVLGGKSKAVELVFETSDRRKLISEWNVAPIRDTDGKVTNVMIILRDLTERRHQDAQRQQGQKMESVGQLAAGIAHEINTPIQFIGDNLRFLVDGFGDLGRVLTAYAQVLAASRSAGVNPALLEEMEAELQRADVAYLTDEIPKAISQSLEGVGRVAEIVRAMKEFSHPDHGEKKPTDINRAILTTLTVARNEYKYVADLVTELTPDLPAVPCIVGEFNQVILNLVVNAAHAIGDVVAKDGGKGTITVSSARVGAHIEVRIADTGTGIPEALRAKIFDPFFTTKEVGKGTGQGLYIAHAVIVRQHGGKLTFESEIGKGTTFIVSMPLAL